MMNMIKVALGRAGVIAAVLLALMAFAPQAEALVANGSPVLYQGGDVTITFLESDADFRSFLYLFDSLLNVRTDTGGIAAHGNFPAGAFFNSDTAVPGVTTFLLPAAYLSSHGYVAGSELIFGILVNETCDSNSVCSDDTVDNTYVMGPAGRNLDNFIHNDTQSGGPSLAIVGFEDIFGGGDVDYNDHKFSFFPVNIPNPGGLVLVGVGLLGFALADWKRRRR